MGVALTDETREPEEATTVRPESQLNRDPQNPDPAEAAGTSQQQSEPEIRETDIASGQPVVALEPLTPPKHKQRFQNRALKYIFWLIIFVTVMTMGTSIGVTLIPDAEVKQTVASLASDIAKSAIPTLIALLGTATAWAFSQDSEKDQ